MEKEMANNTVNESFRENLKLLQALGDPLRQDIIIIIGDEKLSVSEITNKTSVSRPAISHHLKILKEAGVVSMTKQGKLNVYFLDAKKPLKKLKSLIEFVESKCNE